MKRKPFHFERLDNETVMINGVKYKAVEETKPEIQFPKTWEEFCENYKCTGDEYFIDSDSGIQSINKVVPHRVDRNANLDKNLCTNLENAEAILALLQLIQLRDCYNRGWKPDFTEEANCYQIYFNLGVWCFADTAFTRSFLYFKTPELREMFFDNFFDLILKINPLYGFAAD